MPRGRPAWKPSDQDRRQVREMASYGIPIARIASVMGVIEKTLNKHCPQELEDGATHANCKVAGFLFASIMGSPDRTTAPLITDDRARVTAAIFWMKTRGGWRETVVNEHTGKDGAPIIIAIGERDRNL